MKLDRESLLDVASIFLELGVDLAKLWRDRILDLHTTRVDAKRALDLSEENAKDIEHLKRVAGSYRRPPVYK